MVTRYWILRTENVVDDKIYIVPGHDVLPLTYFQTFYPVAKFTHADIDYTIYKSIVPDDVVADLAGEMEGDPLTMASINTLGIQDIYGGEDEEALIANVLDKFGIDLSGSRQVGIDEDGQPIMTPWIIPCRMAGE